MRRAGVTRALALGLALALAAGCARKPAKPAPAPLLAGAPADVAVLLGDPPGAPRGAHETSRPRSAIDWVNIATRTIGPVRVVSPDAPAESLALSRILVVPFALAENRQLARRALAQVDSGRILLIVDLVDPSSKAAAKTQSRGRIATIWHGASVILLMNERTESEIVARLSAATPFPRLAQDPAGRFATCVLAIAGPAATLGARCEQAAASGIVVSAFVAKAEIAVEDLERIRRAGAALGSWFDGGALDRESSPERREALWRGWRKTREKMRHLGANADELSIVYTETPPRSEVSRRLADAGVRLVAASGKPPEWFFSAAAPHQATDRAGGPLPLLVVPVTNAGPLDAESAKSAATTATAATDTSWLAPFTDASKSRTWLTRIDAYARFWEARSRTPLTSTWDGTRLGVECEPSIDGLALILPVSAAGKTLREILFNGATTAGETIEAPDGPCIRLSLTRGRNGVWAIYQ